MFGDFRRELRESIPEEYQLEYAVGVEALTKSIAVADFELTETSGSGPLQALPGQPEAACPPAGAGAVHQPPPRGATVPDAAGEVTDCRE